MDNRIENAENSLPGEGIQFENPIFKMLISQKPVERLVGTVFALTSEFIRDGVDVLEKIKQDEHGVVSPAVLLGAAALGCLQMGLGPQETVDFIETTIPHLSEFQMDQMD